MLASGKIPVDTGKPVPPTPLVPHLTGSTMASLLTSPPAATPPAAKPGMKQGTVVQAFQAQAAKPPQVPEPSSVAAPLPILPVQEPSPRDANAVKIGGLDVPFVKGRKPFPSQLALMAKVINAAQTSKNALLESPTGTGKTLALLCAALAFQHQKRVEYLRAMAVLAATAKMATKSTKTAAEEAADIVSSAKPGASSSKETKPEVAIPVAAAIPKPPRIFFTSRTHSQLAQSINEYKKCTAYHETRVYPVDPAAATAATATTEGVGAPSGDVFDTLTSVLENARFGEPSTSGTAVKLPPSRGQMFVVPPVRMTVLASRSHMCVNDAIISPPKRKGKKPENDQHDGVPSMTVDEACRGIMTDGGCVHNYGTEALQQRLPPVWDIEDIVSTARGTGASVADASGRRKRAGTMHSGCPFFASREAFEVADLVFCPYNYILDPMLRKTMKIDLTGAILIIDEAHNVEDVARDAASAELSREDILECAGSFNRMVTNGISLGVHKPLLHVICKILTWFDRSSEVLGFPVPERDPIPIPATAAAASDGYDDGGGFIDEGGAASEYAAGRIGNTSSGKDCTWSSDTVMATMGRWGMTETSIRVLWEFYAEAEKLKSASKVADLQLSAQSLKTMERLLTVCIFIFMVYAGYYPSLASASNPKKPAVDPFHIVVAAGKTFTPGSKRPGVSRKLHIWCMSPAVSFKDVAATTRSVILTSGTLAPLNSFAAELGVLFPARLEAPHVINIHKQLWVGVIDAAPSATDLVLRLEGTGKPSPWPWSVSLQSSHPSHINLSGVYANAQRDEYVDALGAAVLSMCTRIPGGVLMFLPSYRLLERIVTRWKAIRVQLQVGSDGDVTKSTHTLWEAISFVKHLFVEQRESGDEFQTMLTTFRQQNDATKNTRGHKLTKVVPAPEPAAVVTPPSDITLRVPPVTEVPIAAEGAVKYPDEQFEELFAFPEDPSVVMTADDANLLMNFSAIPTSNAPSISIGKRRRRMPWEFDVPTDDECTEAEDDNSVDEPEAARQTGSLLLAVCRGKASEGIDFSDHHARAVIVVGIPYANVTESQVSLKKSFQDQRSKVHSSAAGRGSAPISTDVPITGSQWYKQQAFRALNQALGRCIRHKNDYGSVILLDPRFNGDEEVNSISKWARPVVRRHVPLFDAAEQVGDFFVQLANCPPEAAISVTEAHTLSQFPSTQFSGLNNSGLSQMPPSMTQAPPAAAIVPPVPAVALTPVPFVPVAAPRPAPALTYSLQTDPWAPVDEPMLPIAATHPTAPPLQRTVSAPVRIDVSAPAPPPAPGSTIQRTGSDSAAAAAKLPSISRFFAARPSAVNVQPPAVLSQSQTRTPGKPGTCGGASQTTSDKLNSSLSLFYDD